MAASFMIWPYSIVCLILLSSLIYGFYRVGVDIGTRQVKLRHAETVRLKSCVEVSKMLNRHPECKNKSIKNAVYKLLPEIEKYVSVKSFESYETDATIYEVSLLVEKP